MFTRRASAYFALRESFFGFKSIFFGAHVSPEQASYTRPHSSFERSQVEKVWRSSSLYLPRLRGRNKTKAPALSDISPLTSSTISPSARYALILLRALKTPAQAESPHTINGSVLNSTFFWGPNWAAINLPSVPHPQRPDKPPLNQGSFRRRVSTHQFLTIEPLRGHDYHPYASAVDAGREPRMLTH
jgi:hypothetical protein